MTQNHKKTQVKSTAFSILVVFAMIFMAIGAGTSGVKAATVKEIGGDLLVGVYEAPATTNPLDATGEEWIMDLLYDSLAVYKPTEGIIPWLASGWEVAADNVTVNVTLRSGVTFTDGSELTSADVVYSYEQYMSGTSIYNGYVSFINTVTAIDDTTVQFVLNAPNSDFFTKAMLVPIIKDGSADSPIGTGPFMDYTIGNRTGTDYNITLNDPNDAGTRKGGTNVEFELSHTDVDPAQVVVHIFPPLLNETGAFIGTNWSAETVLNSSTDYEVDGPNGILTIYSMSEFDYVTVDFTFTQNTFSLSVNPNYFMGRPYIDSVTFVEEVKDSAAVDDLNNRRIDVIFDNVDPYYKSVIEGANVVTPLTTNTIELRINCGVSPLNNSDFRKAVSYAVDKASFVSDTLMNSGIVGDSIIPRDNVFWYNSSLPARPYDKGTASSILTSAGFVDADGDGYVDLPDGTPFHITIKSVGITEDNYLAAEAQVVSVILEEIGINNTWIVDIGANVSADMYNGNFDMVMTRMSYPLDPSYLNDFVTGNANNFMQYSNPDFDAVMQKANSAMDISMKQKYIKDAKGILYDDTAVIVLTYLNGLQFYDGTKYDGYYNMINGINNKFSLLNVYHVIDGSLDMVVIPSTVSATSGDTMTVTVTVTDGSNAIEGAKVVFSVSAGTLSEEEIYTDASGTGSITLTLPEVTDNTDITITVAAYKAGYIHIEKSTAITVKPVSALPQLSLEITNLPQEGRFTVGSGNSTDILVLVTSDNGTVIPDANLIVDLSPSISGAMTSVSTGDNGTLIITFTAPGTTTDIYYTLSVVAEKDGYEASASKSVQIEVVGSPAPVSAGETNYLNQTTYTNETIPGTEQKTPGFEAAIVILAISIATIAFATYRKRE